MVSTKIGPSFFGENYERYVSELTTEGTIAGEKLTPEERKEGFKKKNSKIDFQNFLEKVLERIPQESKEKITEGEISRVNFDRYDRKISGSSENQVINLGSSQVSGPQLKSGNIKSGAIVPISQIISPDQFIGRDEEIVAEKVVNEIRNEVDLDDLLNEIRNEVDLDDLLNEIRNEVEPDTLIKEVIKESDPDKLIEEIVDHVELDNLIDEIRNGSTPVSTQKEIVDVSGLIKANNNLLETNQLIEGFIKAYEKDQIEEEKRLFKEKDKQKKEKKKSLLEAPKVRSVGFKLPSVGKISDGNILEGLAKFGLFSALAGLVQFIPQIIKFVETLPEKINKFFTEDIPNFITEKFKEFKTFVGDFFSDRFEEIKEFFGDLYTKIDDFTGGRLTEFIDGIKGLGPMIIEKSQEFYKTIDDWTGGKISGAFDWIGKNVITPMGDFFKEKIDYVGTKAGELWTNFSSSFLNFFGDIKFELPELPDLGVTEALGLTPQIEGPDLTQDLVAIGGSTAANIAPVSGAKGMAVEGMDAAQVANQIPNMNVGGKSVQLGTGLSQGGTSEDVQKQISGLREGGAKGVQVLGTGNSEKDATLQQIVEQNKDLATFLPAAKSDTGSIDYKATAAAGSQQIQDNVAMREQQRQSGQQPTSSTGPYAGILALLEKYEAGSGKWESMYPGTTLPGATNMTIAEVADKATGAVGMYQNLPEYLNERAVAVNLDPTKDKYTPENQIKIAEYLIEKGQADVTPQMLKDNPDEAMLRLSRVWAAIPVPYDTQGSKRRVSKGESYYAGDGVNKAHITPDMMYSAMKHRPTKPQQSTQPKPVSDILTKSIDQLDSGRSSDQMQNLGTRKVIVPTDKVVPNRDAISVTSRRGQRWGKMHQGTDIAAPSGTPLHAFTDGYITDTGYEGGYGNYIAWKDIYGMEHFYAHLDKIMGKRGDSVKAGSVIGMSGNTGRGSGPHLHWEYGPEGQTGRNGAGLSDPLDKFDYMMPFGSKKIISKPDDAPMPAPTSASAKVSPELGRLKASADSISKPSGRRSGGSVNATTINLPSTERTVPMVGNVQQSSESMMYKPNVSPSNGNDMYKTYTRSLFNIVR